MKKIEEIVSILRGMILLFFTVYFIVFFAFIISNIITIKKLIYTFIETRKLISFDEDIKIERREIIDVGMEILFKHIDESQKTFVQNKIKTKKISKLWSSKLLSFTGFLYAPKTQKEVFEATVADWQEEYFEALFKKEIWKARWINVRYTYAFLIAMWQKSPIGDLIEFVRKFAK